MAENVKQSSTSELPLSATARLVTSDSSVKEVRLMVQNDFFRMCQ